jgi:hypothetical protein
MRRASHEEWIRYYQSAGARRLRGRDPLELYLKRRDTRERLLNVGSTALLAVVLVMFYAILVR